tara:strand:+ start:1715 stop:2311 length:597 start_codon:yes stop_codon:yes gene_type:complete
MKKIFALIFTIITTFSCLDGFINNIDGSKKNNSRLIADADKFCVFSDEYSEIMNKLNDVEKVCNIANEYSGMLKISVELGVKSIFDKSAKDELQELEYSIENMQDDLNNIFEKYDYKEFLGFIKINCKNYRKLADLGIRNLSVKDSNEDFKKLNDRAKTIRIDANDIIEKYDDNEFFLFLEKNCKNYKKTVELNEDLN